MKNKWKKEQKNRNVDSIYWLIHKSHKTTNIKKKKNYKMKEGKI